MKRVITAVTLVCAAASSASASMFWNLGPGATPTSISDNGVVAGTHDFAGQYFYWTPGAGMTFIGGVLPHDGYGGQASISNDGTRIAGTNINPKTSLGEAAYYDIGGSGWTNLGGIGASVDSSLSSGWGISGNGQHVVGLGWTAEFSGHAIHWSQGTGMVDLGTTTPGSSTRANAVNNNGTVIAGWQDNDNGRQGAVWVNGVQRLIFDDKGFGVSEAMAISDDGQWVTGVAYGSLSPYRYNTVTNAFQYLDPAAGDFFFPQGFGTAISDDGATIIGQVRDFGPPLGAPGYIWREGIGAMTMNAYFDSVGLVYEPGFLFSLPMAMSGDGMTFSGWGLSPREGLVGWVVTVPSPASGLVLGLGALVGSRRRRGN